MCGINGILGLEAIGQPRELIGKMNDALSHRGPDADGIFLSEEVALGHRRLAIIDLDKANDQPFREQSGRYTLVYNGELYNFKGIRAELHDYPFITKGDTEVILAAYIKWGSACLQKFNGMFAFAIWDELSKELFIARDRLGIKPLYYSFEEEHLLFSSEMRAILATDRVSKKLRHESLVDYLKYQTVHGPHTILKSIKSLPPGHFLKAQDNEVEIKQYYEPGRSENTPQGTSRAEIKENIQELLYQSVSKRTIADVPFGAFLSGGIDSSAIVGLMSKSMATQVETFSITFAEEEFSEAKYARMVADKFKTSHHEIQLSPENFLDELPHALSSMDHPSGDGPNTYVVSKVTKEAGITMALSGLGGDELFAGYELFKHCADLNSKRWLTSYPKILRRAAGSMLTAIKPGMSSSKAREVLKMDAMTLDHIYPLMRRVLLDKEIEGLIPGGSRMVDPVVQWANSVDKDRQDMPFLSRISILELSSYMQHVLLRDSDQMSMAHALEVRVPFLDHELVDYVLKIKDETKFPHSPKQLLVESLGDLLPPEIVNRPKMGFTLPWDQWMRTDLFDLCDSAISQLKEREIINGTALDGLWKGFLNKDPSITWSRIWPLVVLEKWIEQHGIQA